MDIVEEIFKIISYIEFSANNITIYNINMKINISYTLWVKKNWATFFTANNFRNIEQIFTKFGTNHILFILNIMP